MGIANSEFAERGVTHPLATNWERRRGLLVSGCVHASSGSHRASLASHSLRCLRVLWLPASPPALSCSPCALARVWNLCSTSLCLAVKKKKNIRVRAFHFPFSVFFPRSKKNRMSFFSLFDCVCFFEIRYNLYVPFRLLSDKSNFEMLFVVDFLCHVLVCVCGYHHFSFFCGSLSNLMIHVSLFSMTFGLSLTNDTLSYCRYNMKDIRITTHRYFVRLYFIYRWICRTLLFLPPPLLPRPLLRLWCILFTHDVSVFSLHLGGGGVGGAFIFFFGWFQIVLFCNSPPFVR